MIWENAKTKENIVLDGITVEVDKAESSLVCVTFTDAKGSKVRARLASYNLVLEVPAKPKTEEKYNLRGFVNGLPVDEFFDHEYQAENRQNELVGYLLESKYDLVITKTQVIVEDAF